MDTDTSSGQNESSWRSTDLAMQGNKLPESPLILSETIPFQGIEIEAPSPDINQRVLPTFDNAFQYN